MVACKKNVSQRKAPGAMSAIAFIVRPVKPKVVCIFTGAESAIHFLLFRLRDCLIGEDRGARVEGALPCYLLP
jgi:hypothetical protein